MMKAIRNALKNPTRLTAGSGILRFDFSIVTTYRLALVSPL
jgi:hypothetical protein